MCIQSSCTIVYNLALDRGRRSLQIVIFLMRSLAWRPFYYKLHLKSVLSAASFTLPTVTLSHVLGRRGGMGEGDI